MIQKDYPDFNEHVYIIKLKNGMQIHILPKDDPYYSTYVELSIPYGALNLSYKVDNAIFDSPYGTAHFLEHKVFAMPDGDAFQVFSKMGVDANAMTSYNQTSYLFNATKNVMEALDFLLHMIDTPFINKENVESEKHIIGEELKMYLDDPNVVMHNELMEQLYFNHPIRYDIGGTLDSIQEIDEKVLNHVYESFYQPSNRLIVIAGHVDIKALKTYFKNYEHHAPQKAWKPITLYPKEPKRMRTRKCVVTKELGINKLMIGFKLQPKHMTARQRVKREMTMTIMTNLLLGNSSSMYEMLLEKGLINMNFSLSTQFENRAESLILYAESKKIYTLKRLLIDFLTKEGIDALTEDAFTRYQKVYLGQIVYALNQLEYKAYLYGKYHHLGTNLFDVVDILKEITLEDVRDAFHEMSVSPQSLLIYKKA